MFRNYLAAALRNMVHNKLYAVLNITGLAVGLAAAMLIALFVRDELSFNRWIPEFDRIYLLTDKVTLANGQSFHFDSAAITVATVLKTANVGEQVARVVSTRSALRRGDIESFETVWWADAEFFSIIALPTIAGDLQNALREPDGVVVTRTIARKYFGRDAPIGELIEFDRLHPLRITAVVEDLPPNSSFTMQIFAAGDASFSRLRSIEEEAKPTQSGLGNSVYTFLRLARPRDVTSAEQQIVEAINSSLADRIEFSRRGGIEHAISLLSLADLHFASGRVATFGKGDKTVVGAAAALGGLIIVIACINFVNLVTARGTSRAVEVGVRKVSGAYRRHVMSQFIAEAAVYAVIGVAVAAALASLAKPALAGLLQRDFAHGLSDDPLLLGIVTGLVLAVGVFAGAYPAIVLGALHPAIAVKGPRGNAQSSPGLRRVLVMLQFAVLIVLVVGASAMYRQIRYVTSEALRLDIDQVVTITTACTTSFKEELRVLPGVKAVACSAPMAVGSGTAMGPKVLADGTQVTTAHASVDVGFFELFGLRPLAGRFFAQDKPGDALAADAAPRTNPPMVVINETAVRTFNFGSPAAAIGQTIRTGTPENAYTGPASVIIGVVPDGAVDNIRAPIAPTVYFFDKKQFGVLSAKLGGEDLPETLEAVDDLWKQAGDPRPIRRSFLSQSIENKFAAVKRQAETLSVFAGIAIFIAALGLFGLAAFTAEQRTKEIGVRKVMGARTRDILGLLLWQFTKPVLWANVFAWPVGYFVMRRWLEGFAYHIELSPWMFLGASGLALVIAIATVAGHAILVARAQPVTALRYE